MSKRRRGIPSEARVKRGDRGVRGESSSSKGSAGTTPARADQGGAFKRCCMLEGNYDGEPRNYYRRD